MKLESNQLKRIINEELEAVISEYEYGKFPNKPGEYKNPWTGEELTPEQQARLDQPLDHTLDQPQWFFDLKMRYKNDNRTPEEVARDDAEAAARDIKYEPDDHDATTPMPTPAFSTVPVGPDGEITIRGIQMMDREDDDKMLYPEGLMYEGDDSILALFEDATLEEGGHACGACLFEMLQEASCGCPDLMGEAVYQGKTVQLNKPTRGDVKKFKVYVNSGKKDKEGRVKAKKINFGDKKMKIKKSNPKRRKSFRARHKCHTAKDKKTARYWSCKKW